MSGTSGTARALLVLGMHRSGTSALTRTLNLLGAQLPTELMPAAAGNPQGYWEGPAIVHQHDRLLAVLGRSWDDVRALPDRVQCQPFAERTRAALVGIVRQQFGAAPLLVVKDPRMCRLAWLWRAVADDLGITPCFVIAVRHPLEVARSLEVRDNFPSAKSLLLWLRYMLEAERDTRGSSRIFISYEALLTNWRPEMARLGATFGLAWPVDPAEAIPAIDTFLSAPMRHHVGTDNALEDATDISPWIKATYGALLAAATGEDDAVTPVFDEIAGELERAEMLLGPLFNPGLFQATLPPLPNEAEVVPVGEPKIKEYTVRTVARPAQAPRFSIIVPDYEDWVPRERFQRGMACLAAQSFRNFEVILLHDGPKRQPFTEDANLSGVPVTKTIITDRRYNDWGHSLRDIGIHEASGDYIIHFNPDNVLYPHALSCLDKSLRAPYPLVHFTNTERVHPMGDAIIIFPIIMRGTAGCGTAITRVQGQEDSYSMILSGYPVSFSTIDCMQLVMRRALWLEHGGWSDRRSFSDGILYERFVNLYGARYVADILGEHW